MKLHYRPQVELVGLQIMEIQDFLKNHGLEGWNTDTTIDCEELVEVAGRLCYMSFSKPRPGGNKAYINHILQQGHGSVLEHAVFNFIFTGISRSLSHELVRHRAGWGYSQLSQRYVDESVAEFVVPWDLKEEVSSAMKYMEKAFPDNNPNTTIFQKILECEQQLFYNGDLKIRTGLNWLRSAVYDNAYYKEFSDYLYNRLTMKEYTEYFQNTPCPGNFVDPPTEENLKEFIKILSQEKKTALRKGARQAARSVLPNATETKIFATANARSLRHFIEMRASQAAEPEIRMLAIDVLKTLQKCSMNLFVDYTIEQLPDGSEIAHTPYRKV